MINTTRNKRKQFFEINITPLTDVALVLLIIFMITAMQKIGEITEGIKVNRPGAVMSDVQSGKEIIVSVTEQGKVFLANIEMDPRNLMEPLALLLVQSKTKIVVVNADKKAEHGTVVSVMDAARRAGADKLFVSTTQLKPEKK